jgi:hypothetical protein
MQLCTITFSTPTASARPTLTEQTLLNLQYDGPVPPYALADLRRMPQRPFTYASLTDSELAQWLALAHATLKAEQRSLLHARGLCAAHKTWRLKQCHIARAEWHGLAAEHARRAYTKTRVHTKTSEQL